MPEAIVYRIRDWDKHFENNRSRELAYCEWFKHPNDFGEGYVELLAHLRGSSHYGTWCALCCLASRTTHKRGILLKKSGEPHDLRSIGLACYIPMKTVREAVERLLKIGWLETITPAEIPQATDVTNVTSTAKTPQRKRNGMPIASRARSADETETETETETNERKLPQQYGAPSDVVRSLLTAPDSEPNEPPEAEQRGGLRSEDITRVSVMMKSFAEHLTRSPWKAPDWRISRDVAKLCNGHYAEAERYMKAVALQKRPVGGRPVEMRSYALCIKVLETHFASPEFQLMLKTLEGVETHEML